MEKVNQRTVRRIDEAGCAIAEDNGRAWDHDPTAVSQLHRKRRERLAMEKLTQAIVKLILAHR
jgi:hypothetical protein